MVGNISFGEVVPLLLELKRSQPRANKAQIEAAFLSRTSVKKERSVYVGNGYVIRFSEANNGSFSNVVLGCRNYRNTTPFQCSSASFARIVWTFC